MRRLGSGGASTRMMARATSSRASSAGSSSVRSTWRAPDGGQPVSEVTSSARRDVRSSTGVPGTGAAGPSVGAVA